MLDLSPEIDELRTAGVLSDRDAAVLIARERRAIFSIRPELRAMSWGGALLVAAGAAALLARNLERIGPIVLAGGVGVAALLAYGYAAWRRRAARISLVDEYILLLGALLLSADLAYLEGQFHLLDHGWPRHLLLMAVVHGATAYWFESRMLLSLSLAAMAAWMGIEQRVERIFDSTIETALRALACSAVIVMWRAADARWRTARTFAPVFEHFAANLALFGALILTVEKDTRGTGLVLIAALAAVVIRHGFRVRAESFVIYAYAYAVLAIDIAVVDILDDGLLITSFLLLSTIAAIAGLFALHAAYRRREP
ncbi:MAG TPA: DUF2157 domain-containing protein [Thermoanaerobaculia bacterium]|nr:DUF2157 domain-containing protein [Thermoanaerobaculia bacterium]